MHTLDHEPSDRVEAPARFAPGTTIAHFRIVRELGAGGMGVVFEAQDADLDRRVAIKVVRDHNAGSAAGLRLIREAQAMARLTHPNVVTVHEVGTIDDQVYVVMELVRGSTLADWLGAPRPWREIVDTFIAAAQGLLAAHHAGLVHRDFKPSNVLVDPNGRVRVSDFGLAHGDDQLAEGSEPAGTLAYMAPEQRAGRAIDARADQYAFAIALQEALAPKKAIGKVPRRIKHAITRALSIDPDERFPTLAELAAALRAPRRRSAMVAVGAAAVAGVAAFALLDTTRSGAISCADGATLVDRVWSPAIRTGQLARFVSHAPHALVAIGSSLDLVDDWAASWKLGRRAACAVEEPQRTARLGCLDRELHQLHAQLAVWAQADPALAETATRAASALPSVDACAAQTRDAPISPLVLDRIAQVDALVHSGRAPAALPEVEPLLALAGSTGNPRDLAAALRSAGLAELEGGQLKAAHDHFTRAAQEAGRANDDQILVEALIDEAHTTANLGHPNDSLGLLDAAQAITLRGGVAPSDAIALARGDALHDAGRIAEAIGVLKPLVTAAEARAARDPRQKIALSLTLARLASAMLDAEDFAGAHTLYLRCVALDEASYGQAHPEVAKSLADLAISEYHLDRYEESHAHLDRARKILATTYGERGLLVGKLDVAEATLATRENHNARGISMLEAAAKEFTGVLAPDHPYFGSIEQQLGELLRAEDRCAEALPHIEKSLRMQERAGLARRHALQLTDYGACLVYTDRLAEGKAALEQSLAEMDEVHATTRWYAEPKAILGEVEWDQRHKAAAIALIRASIAAARTDDSQEMRALATNEEARLAEMLK